MRFRDVIGHASLKEQLCRSAQGGQLGHAYLFNGSPGSGGLPLAWALARYMLCEQRTDEDACGQCPACLKTGNLSHADLHLSFPIRLTKKTPTCESYFTLFREALLQEPYLNEQRWYERMEDENKQGVIGVEESSRIVRNLSLKAYEGGYKVMIIWMAERLRTEAANKLLKIIEEPPRKTLFLLVTNDQEQLLPTIRSRTRIVTVPPVDDGSIAEALSKEAGIPPERASGIARLAEGNYYEALQLAKEEEHEEKNFKAFSQWMRLCYQRDVPQTLDWVEEIAGIGREKQKNFLNYSLHMIRQCLLFSQLGEAHARVEGKELDFIRNFAPFIREDKVAQIAEEIEQGWQEVSRNINPRILFLDLSFRIFSLIPKKEELV